MLRLLRKDLIFNWKALATSYVLWSVFWLGYPALRPGGHDSFDAWAGMVSLACAFLPVMVVAREDKFKAGALACSLPVTRRSIVLSRYVEGWMVALAGAGIAVGIMATMSRAGMTELAPPAADLPFRMVVVVGVVLAVFLPFTLRFGIAGLIGFLVAAQLVGVALLLASAMFGAGAGLAAAVTSISGAVAWMHATLGPRWFLAMLLTLVLALNLASCRLSASIYRRRDF